MRHLFVKCQELTPLTQVNTRCEIIGDFRDSQGNPLRDAKGNAIGNFWQNGHFVNLNERVALNPQNNFKDFWPFQINDNGAMLCYATNLTNNTRVVVLLVPIDLRLLTGQTTNVFSSDGKTLLAAKSVDFEGNTPTGITNPDISDNTTISADLAISGTQATNPVGKLGDLGMGSGASKKNYKRACLVVAGPFLPSFSYSPGAYPLTYTWRRWYRDRFWRITSSTFGVGNPLHWVVTFLSGTSIPKFDNVSSLGQNWWVSSYFTTTPTFPKGRLYNYDDPGDAPLTWNANTQRNDFVYSETDFFIEFTVSMGRNQDGSPNQILGTATRHVGLTVAEQRVADTGTVTTVWKPLGIKITEAPPDLTILNRDDNVHAVTGGNLPITYSSY